ncbi:TIGR01244 family sulfur transferase [Devosia sp. MC521]|uniref:TIGR01244 family sulfur transferase n=1 Tax=Devosia sp. MC521 TaxID=2759954 RepID=UPI0015FDA613|nr:TIGR01244 family sulfur transferase [Devosia sp. MC521]MBJ6987378.1 TIGR01244 family phosphatase [Devosia sp. MC521]QMW63550.1 TIGR01244 family phosphatase [Devosia sp. MC521]
MKIKIVDERFGQTGQIQTSEIPEIVAAGYKGIVCARPDDEDPNQPSFDDIAAAASAAGLQAFHVPVSGPLGEGQLIKFTQALEAIDGPVLGYCRSGGRAGSLYAATR